MTMLLFIPSRGRFTPKELKRGVLADIPPSWRSKTTMVVPAAEYGLYLEGLRAIGPVGDSVSVKAKTDIDGISATRQWCGKLAHDRCYDKFVMLDDDIRFLVRRDVDTWRMKSPPAPREVEACLWRISKMLDTHAHGGVSSRDGNNRAGIVGPDFFKENERYLRLLAFRTYAFLSCEHGRVPVMEDFDVSLQLLSRGFKSFVLYYWAQGQTMTNAAGGCSTYRTHELHEAAARKLAELHPGVVSLRTAHKKMDAEGFGTRTEVTIQWKKAYERGVAK